MERFPISFVSEFLTIVTVISYEKSFANAFIAVSFSERLSSASFFVIPAALSAGSSAAIPGVRTYISLGISIYISTFLMLYVAYCILSISIFEDVLSCASVSELSCAVVVFGAVSCKISVFSDCSSVNLLLSCADTSSLCPELCWSSGAAYAVTDTDKSINAAAIATASLFIERPPSVYLSVTNILQSDKLPYITKHFGKLQTQKAELFLYSDHYQIDIYI